MPDAETSHSNATQLILTPLKPAVIEGVAQKLPVLVRVQTPDPEPGQQTVRKPYHVSLVLDRSGSMSGDPIIEAVRCAHHVIDRLEPTDVASLVIFDHRVQTLVPAQAVGDRKTLHTALSQIHSGGNTDLCGGWKAGADTLRPGAAESALARVILLSDGNANSGETSDTAEIAAFCEQAAREGVTTSTYGLGRDFNEELMVEMARKGLGNHYYGDTAADLFEPFAEEFDLISSLHSRHVRLSLGAPQGVKIVLINDYPVEDRDGFPDIRLPDIPWGAEAWALVELEIPAGLALESGNQFLQASVTSVTPEGEPVSWPEPRALMNLGRIHLQGEGGEQDTAAALEYFRESWEGGEAVAGYWIGAMLMRGDGGHRDPELGREWYEKAARADCNEVCSRLGNDHEYGSNGAEKDSAKALAWYQMGAERGDTECQKCLGAIHLSGDGMPKDGAEAVYWLSHSLRGQASPDVVFSLNCFFSTASSTHGSAQPLHHHL